VLYGQYCAVCHGVDGKAPVRRQLRSNSIPPI
jgi:mono/diheme cytochrome c family protein